jgi:alpha-1,3-rhamnosyl/mannosyltransferase
MPRPDVAHAPGNAPWGWFPNRSVPSVLTVHDVVFWHERASDWTAGAYRERMDRSLAPILPRADAILTVSRFSKREIVRLTGVPPERVFVSPIATQWTGPPPTEAEAADRVRRLGLAPGTYLLAVGDVTPRKNYEGLLRAFDRLRERAPEAELVVVGRYGFGSREAIDRLRAGAGETRWLTEIPTADLRALYAAARAFVLPSWYEGFGIPVLEAMAAGCPVCCSTGSSLDEVAGEDALRVAPADADGLADALHRLWTDAELREALRRAGRTRSARFSWDVTAGVTLRAYAYAVAHRRGDAAAVADGNAAEAALPAEDAS